MTRKSATLLVIEFGASWPRWLDPSRAGNIAAVAQHYEGPPASLVTQVESRMRRLLAMRWQIAEVVLVSNGRRDIESLAARSVLARRLLAQLEALGGGRLTLTVDSALGRRAWHGITALGAALEKSALSNGVAVTVHLGESDPVAREPSDLETASAS